MSAGIERVPPGSWKTVAMNLPHTGNLDVNIQVVRGGPVDVFLTDTAHLAAVQQGDWTHVRTYADFNALKAKTCRRVGILQDGNYYLVLRGTSPGNQTSSASDVSLRVQLNP